MRFIFRACDVNAEKKNFVDETPGGSAFLHPFSPVFADAENFSVSDDPAAVMVLLIILQLLFWQILTACDGLPLLFPVFLTLYRLVKSNMTSQFRSDWWCSSQGPKKHLISMSSYQRPFPSMIR